MLTVLTVLNAQQKNNPDPLSSTAISSLALNGAAFSNKPVQVQNSGLSLVNELGNVADNVNVTFQVDMKNENLSNDSVLIIGSWDSWAPMMMTANGTVYSVSLTLPVGTEHQYKFIKGLNDWETIPNASCTAEGNDNRLLIVPDSDTTLPVVCFGECGTCISWYAPHITIREVQGEGEVTPYLDQDIKTEGVITAINQYGAYIQDTSDFRSGLFVYEPNLIWQYSRGQSVHFIATATEYGGLTEILGVQYSVFSEKQYAVTPLNIQITDIGEETEGVLSTLSNVEVLYMDGFSQYVVRNETGDTAIISNYLYQPFLEIGSSYNITGVVDYRHSKYMLEPRDRDDLQNLTHPPVDITFRVDMQNEIVSPNGVHLNGSFVDWSEEIEMNVVSEQIYSVTLTLAVGETFTYKFVNGGTFEWDKYENPPEKCSVGLDNNREITVPGTNIVLDVVCFNSCYNCDKPDELNISINKTLDPPLIDGFPDPVWDKADAVPIERDFTGESPTVTASWKAMYDDDNIYVLVEVQDDDHYPAWEAGIGDFWEYDQAELYFDVNSQLLDGFGPSTGGSGHWIFSEAMVDGGYGNPQVSDALAAPVSWCYTLSGENYTLEYAFPFSSLTQNDGSVLDVNDFKNLGAFGFDITIDDRDLTKDSRDRKVWQNIGVQDEAYNNMDDCGTISLSDEIIAQDNTLQLDSLALVALYNATNGGNWTNSENWLNGPVSTWFGVTVENDRVSEIIFQGNNLNGNLPAEIGDLTALRTLDLRFNNGLSDSFPIEICQLLNLEYIDFYQCRFYGDIPSEIGNLVNLTYLNLGINYGLTGSIPVEIGDLTNLQYLFLHANQLVGTIPTEIASLSNLLYLFLYGNQLSGSIPDFDQLPSLTRCYLHGNNFDELPDITRPSGLANFWVQDNNLTFEDLEYNMDLTESTEFVYASQKSFGTAENAELNMGDSYSLATTCGGTQNMYQWYLNGLPYSDPSSSPDFFLENVDYSKEGAWVCHVSNSLVPGLELESEPISVKVLGPCNVQDSLTLVDLYNSMGGPSWTDNENWLNGPVYTWHGIEMQGGRVTEIWLDQNNLSDSLPASLAQLSMLQILAMGGNGFGGDIPEELGNLSQLRYLWLWGNQMTGTIPASLGQLSNLNILSLNGNNLSGNIPSELGWCDNLWAINLDYNYLDGKIPVELCNISSLNSVNFAQNNFDAESCAAITCLSSNGVNFPDSPDQTQRGGYSLTNDCDYVADSTWVTFRVNMQNESVSAGMYINGSFCNWSTPVELQLDSLSYYSASLLLPAGQSITYKFINGDFYETPPSNCTVGDYNDRELYVPHSSNDLVLDAVCFAGCQNCADNTVPQFSISEIQGTEDISPLNGQVVRTKGRITGINQYGFFMQDASGARNGIFVYDPALATQLYPDANIEIIAEVAEYNGKTELLNTQWFDFTDEYFEVNPSSIEVAEINEDYEGVLISLNYVTVLSQNQYQEYIAVSDQGDTCVIDNYLMQPVLEIGVSYIIYGIVDYQYETFRVNPRSDGDIGKLYDLTFQVDMQNEQIDQNGVFVGGDWNDWMSWNEPALMSASGSVYSYTVKMLEGYTVNYRFRNGYNWENVIGDCSYGENGDRSFTMPASSVVLDPVCFAKCIACDSINTNLPAVSLEGIQVSDALCYGSVGEAYIEYNVIEVGTIQDRGILIGSHSNLLYDGTLISEGTGAGYFSATVGDLEAGTYYVCAYAENETGTSYSDVEQIYIAQPDYLEMYVTENLHETSVYCDIYGIGGTQPYMYQLTICDDENNCIERSWQVDSYFIVEGLEQLTNYQADLAIMDANGCTNMESYSFMLAPDNSLQIDSIALVELYYATDGPNWTNNENWLTGPLDTWYGVTVQNGRVVLLNLNNNNLVGTLPSRIGKLSALQEFVLWGNQLMGELPGELGTMSSLVTLDLGLNQFVGEIPPQLGELSNLEELFIGSGSQLSGEIPASLGQLSNLRTLALDANQLTGIIPEELGNLSQLTNLFLQGNQLYGNLPASFGNLQNLGTLFLNNNSLSGPILVELCNLPLQTINLEQNLFHIYACDAIRCLKDGGVFFAGDSLQTQQNGIELTQDCYLPSLKIIALVAPPISDDLLCNPSETETVNLLFYNNGVEAIDSAALICILNGDTLAVEAYLQTILPGDTISYEFTATANLKPVFYMQKDTLRVILRWAGGMINGWSQTKIFTAIDNSINSPGWNTFNTCNGLSKNVSFSISEDRNGNIWSSHFNGADQYNGSEWSLFKTQNGLGDDYNWAIEHDRSGNLWFAGATTPVITKYNGTGFMNFPQSAIYEECIYADTQGNVWFGSYEGNGLAMFDGQNWTYYSIQQANLGTAVLSIGEDSNGNLYFATSTGITRFDGSNWSTFEIPGNSYQINEIFFDSKGFTWFTASDAIYRYNGVDWTVFSDAESIVMNCTDIAEDQNGNLWFGGGNELAKFDGSNWTKYHVEDGLTAAAGGSIFAVYADTKNDIWIGTYGGGISRFEQASTNLGIIGLVTPVQNPYSNYLYCGLSNNEPITARIYNDGDFPIENAVIGYSLDDLTVSLDTLDIILQPGDTINYTFNNGADFYHTDFQRNYQLEIFIQEETGNPYDNSLIRNMRVDGDYEDLPGWTTYNSCNGLISDISFGITEDGDGNIWSTGFYGADRFDGSQWSTFTVNDGLTENYSWAIEHDNDGNIWFAGSSSSSFTKYDGTTFTDYPQPAYFNECMYNDSQGNMWFGSWDGDGVARFDGQNWTYFMNDAVDFGNNIYSIGEDANGNILVSCFTSEGPKIKMYNGNAWFDFIIPENIDLVSEIYFDSNQNTWFTTATAYYKFDGSNWDVYNSNDGILDDLCQDISEDIYGNIWFGGGREIVKYNGTSWEKFTAEDGMAPAWIGDIYALFADSEGNIWVGTYRGGISKFTIPVNEICTTLQFQTGWNLFSSPAILTPDSVGFNFQSLIDNASLVKIQDELGNAFEDQGIFGSWDDSEIKPIRPYDGFKINVSHDDSVQFCGKPVTYPYPIYLYEGWNIMGYPQTMPVDASEIMQDLIDKGSLVKVQDEEGSSIEDLGVFGGWTNFIGNFNTGEGYKVKVSTHDTLWIYESYPKSTLVERPKVQPLHFTTEYRGNGVDHMNLNVVDLPLGILNTGDELAVYDGAVCVGAATIMPQDLERGVVSIAVSAADNYGMPGFGEGNAYTLRLWQQKTRIEQKLDPDILKGPAVFTKHESAMLSLKNFTGIEEGSMQEESVNCYPNPFHNELVIEANFVSDRSVEIRILNQLGQVVNVLVNKQEVTEGLHRWTWNGTNGSGQKVEPGIYYIRLSAGDRIVVNKVVLTK